MCINTHIYVTCISIKYIHFVVILFICEIVHFEIPQATTLVSYYLKALLSDPLVMHAVAQIKPLCIGL